MATLVYILGRRYCGSTLTSALLNHAPDIESVGEVIEAARVRTDRPCSCGEQIDSCGHLGSIRDAFEARSPIPWAQAVQFLKEQSAPQRLFATWRASSEAPWVRTLAQVTTDLVEAVAEVTGAPFVLDASKEVPRGLLLARFQPDVKILHLVRHPERLAASQLRRLRKGSGFSMFGRTMTNLPVEWPVVAMSGAGWAGEYAADELVRRAAPDRVLRVRYEDLMAAPSQQLDRIGQFLGTDLSSVSAAVENQTPLSPGHSFGSNLMRLRGSVVFDPRAGQRTPLAVRHRLLTRAICWPLMLRHGYPLLADG